MWGQSSQAPLPSLAPSPQGQTATESYSRPGLLQVMSSPLSAQAEFHTLRINTVTFLEYVQILILGLASGVNVRGACDFFSPLVTTGW